MLPPRARHTALFSLFRRYDFALRHYYAAADAIFAMPLFSLILRAA